MTWPKKASSSGVDGPLWSDDRPPAKGTTASAVPWKARRGTGREGEHPSGWLIPATETAAAIRSARSHTSRAVKNPPFDIPVE